MAKSLYQSEKEYWEEKGGEWKQLYGNYEEQGVSIEWHSLEGGMEWGGSFHEGSLEICLNLSGEGVIRQSGGVMRVKQGTLAMYWVGEGGVLAQREGEGHHEFLTIEMSMGYLRGILGRDEKAVVSWVREIIRGDEGIMYKKGVGGVRELSAGELRLARELLNPPVTVEAAQTLWYCSRISELMALSLFEKKEADFSGELFCERHKRMNQERVEEIIEELRKRLDTPLNLQALGKAVGCSPTYLSRIFSETMGTTLARYFREMRMEKAAQLLLEGKMNVTEVALEVGYNSMSHFAKAFTSEMGCTPSQFTKRPGRQLTVDS